MSASPSRTIARSLRRSRSCCNRPGVCAGGRFYQGRGSVHGRAHAANRAPPSSRPAPKRFVSTMIPIRPIDWYADTCPSTVIPSTGGFLEEQGASRMCSVWRISESDEGRCCRPDRFIEIPGAVSRTRSDRLDARGGRGGLDALGRRILPIQGRSTHGDINEAGGKSRSPDPSPARLAKC